MIIMPVVLNLTFTILQIFKAALLSFINNHLAVIEKLLHVLVSFVASSKNSILKLFQTVRKIDLEGKESDLFQVLEEA